LNIRRPVQAGVFYAGSASSLRKEIEGCFEHQLGPGRLPEKRQNDLTQIVALVCPHAGYVYSGPVAAAAYSELARHGKPNKVVIIGPNHTGMGSGISLMNEGSWETPLGEVQIDLALADAILENAPIIDMDDKAHAHEHSVEVQLPFLQYLYGNSFKFVPICMMIQDLQTGREVGEAIAKVAHEPTSLVVASSDMTHYEPHDVASEKDRKAIRAIETLDEAALEGLVESDSISICGIGPIIAAIAYSKRRGATAGKLLCYKTSGDISGDYSSVVGYASISFSV
jgi:AmmeMemoRadiSam system protein B